MAADWLLQTIYAALISQAAVPSGHPPTNPTVFPNRPLVHTLYGDVLGVQKLSSFGTIISTFFGIPFASPPVGNLRFDQPVPPSNWQDVRDASEFGNECFQHVFPDYSIQLSEKPLARTEDCLYLNVYKPETVTVSGELLPVMVWIHGGAFIFGAGSQYDGTDLAANGVIVVTINYRLDMFGFLSNQDDVIPGNYGMLDQVMALKWVQQNIKSFGGDPDKVTIFGESAGSASVSMLVLSPLAKGLFSRAIMESGTSLSPWGVHFPTERVTPSQMTDLIVSRVGCTDTDPVRKLECLRKVDAETLFNSSLAAEETLGLGLTMKPTVETKFGFLPDRPVNLWTQGKFNHVDTIRGFTKAESAVEALLRSNYSLSLEQFIVGVRTNLGLFAIADIDEIMNSILLSKNISASLDGHDIFMKLVETLTDINFRGGVLLEQNMESKMAPETKHYVYEFDYKPSRSLTPPWMPAAHGEDLQFVFGVNLRNLLIPETPPSAIDQLISKLIQRMWTNFAKYGTPTRTPSFTGTGSGALNWSPYYGESTANVLRIGPTSQEVSFKNHLSARIFQKVLTSLGTVTPDKFIVG